MGRPLALNLATMSQKTSQIVVDRWAACVSNLPGVVYKTAGRHEIRSGLDETKTESNALRALRSRWLGMVASMAWNAPEKIQ